MASRPFHLLYFITEDWFFCSHFLDRAIAAHRAGYGVTVLTQVGAHGDCIRRAGLSLIPIRLRRRSLNPVRELQLIVQIAHIYRRQRPDLVHHFALKPILYGTLAARMAGISRCVNAPLGMGFVFASDAWRARLLRPWVRLALRFSLNPSGSRVIFENADDREESIRDGLVQPQDAVLIPGAGVDPDRFPPRKPSGQRTPPAVVLVSRMLWEKGVGDFVAAARLIRDRGIPARFLLVGAPDRENPGAIPEAQLQVWAREGVVEWLGHRTDIPAILADCQIFCLPSAYREGLPKAILEALAAGLPVVTTDRPGCREAVRQGENGILVPPRDPQALADALEELLRDPERCRRMGQRGRRRAEREFTSARVCEATLALYRGLLSVPGEASHG